MSGFSANTSKRESYDEKDEASNIVSGFVCCPKVVAVERGEISWLIK